jgi:hypothetical protein
MTQTINIEITKNEDKRIDMKVSDCDDADLVTLGMAVVLFMQDHVTLVKYLNAVKEHLKEEAERGETNA